MQMDISRQELETLSHAKIRGAIEHLKSALGSAGYGHAAVQMSRAKECIDRSLALNAAASELWDALMKEKDGPVDGT